MSLGKMVIASASVVTIKVGPKSFEVTSQQGVFHAPNGSVNACKFGVDGEKGPWPVGEFELSGDSLHVDKYGRLELRPVLVLVPVAVAKPVGVAKAS